MLPLHLLGVYFLEFVIWVIPYLALTNFFLTKPSFCFHPVVVGTMSSEKLRRLLDDWKLAANRGDFMLTVAE